MDTISSRPVRGRRKGAQFTSWSVAVTVVAVLASAGCGRAPVAADPPPTAVTAVGTGAAADGLAGGAVMRADEACEQLDVVVALHPSIANVDAEDRQLAVDAMNRYISAGRAGVEELVGRVEQRLPAGAALSADFVDGTTGSATATELRLSAPIDERAREGCRAGATDDLGSFFDWTRIRATLAAGAASIAAAGIATAATAATGVGTVVAGSVGGFFGGFVFALVKNRVEKGALSAADWGDSLAIGLVGAVTGGVLGTVFRAALEPLVAALVNVAQQRFLGFVGALGIPDLARQVLEVALTRIPAGPPVAPPEVATS